MTKDEIARFNEATPLLTTLLGKGSKPVFHNKTKLQKDDASTCGRWAAARIMNMEMPLPEFIGKMKGGAGSPDQNVTAYTYSFLHK